MSDVTDYLDSLKWDGCLNIERFAADPAFGQPSRTNVDTWHDFFVNAVRRAYEPGCGAQRVVVLCGVAGVGKSTLIRDLVGPWYLCASRISKDVILSEAWIVEFTDLTYDQAKLQVELRSDRVRRPYERQFVDVPRAWLPVLTTNTRGPFEGARRFAIVEMVKPLHLDGMRRDQIWAEAVATYRAGDE